MLQIFLKGMPATILKTPYILHIEELSACKSNYCLEAIVKPFHCTNLCISDQVYLNNAHALLIEKFNPTYKLTCSLKHKT